ncbi:NAD(P)H-binding protein [Altererythrobacter salegens]|uniref:NAD(P)H-binding protein n=1 Tax=Croceibacterium salegens TaxID=1737568 RepID=A0A6I4T0B4_9SPHN|nr:NAD(P)H-binding protein [Croceibacterium salegens]MXO60646.1 NAD(P)H-binding protein [Croceibacterium salegens]
MRIALVGATGFIGSKVLTEASRRKHTVTAITRNSDNVPRLPGVTACQADIQSRSQAVSAFKDHDIVVSCFNAGHHPSPGQNVYKDTINGVVNIIKATKAAGVNRLLFVGGAGALYIEPGVQLIDIFPGIGDGEVSGHEWPEDLSSMMPPEFALWDEIMPDETRHEHIQPLVHALMFFEHDRTYDWSFFSPPAGLHPGAPRGSYQVGTNQVPMDGSSYAGLSLDDAALAIVDEVEAKAHNHEHWTAFLSS